MQESFDLHPPETPATRAILLADAMDNGIASNDSNFSLVNQASTSKEDFFISTPFTTMAKKCVPG